MYVCALMCACEKEWEKKQEWTRDWAIWRKRWKAKLSQNYTKKKTCKKDRTKEFTSVDFPLSLFVRSLEYRHPILQSKAIHIINETKKKFRQISALTKFKVASLLLLLLILLLLLMLLLLTMLIKCEKRGVKNSLLWVKLNLKTILEYISTITRYAVSFKTISQFH